MRLFQSVLEPKFVGDAVGLTITLTFMSLVFWSFVLGPLGALLAVPLSLFVKAVLIDTDPATHWIRPLIGDQGATSDVEWLARTPTQRQQATSEE